MWISAAYAQAAAPQGPSFLVQIFPFVLIFGIFYFFLIRPQQKRVRDHQAMVAAVRRGDTVVTSGGIVGKVSKVVDDNEIMVDIADGVSVRVMKATLSDVRSKTQPAAPKADDAAKSEKTG
ncbi:MAG: preprotein translocase subunit YajC [Pseudomonadota bacterium]